MASFRCPFCPSRANSTFQSQANLVHHIVKLHRDKEKNLIYECFTCSSKYSSYKALIAHHWRSHQHRVHVEENPPDPPVSADQEETTEKEEEDIINEAGSAPKLEDELQFQAASLIINIREKLNAPQTVVDAMVEGVNKLVDTLLSIIQNHFALLGVNHAYSVDEIVDTIQSLRGNSLFEGVSSQQQLLKYLVKADSVVPPVKVVCLSKDVVQGNKIVRKDLDFGYRVPFLPMLEQVLSCPEVLNCVDNPKVSKDNEFASPLDGFVYRNHPTVIKHPKALAFSLYQDDAGSTDLASSKSTANNVRYIYWTLLNIDPELRSSTQSINLLCCVKTKVIKKYGYDKFMKDFVDSINKLSSKGVRLKINGVYRRFYGIFLFASGDNPASASLGAFKESHFAQLACRQCPTLTIFLHTCFKEEEIELRSKESHEKQVLEIEAFRALPSRDQACQQDPSVKYGINGRSVLMGIEGCDVTKCLPQDLMHDVVEGTLHLEICLLLNHVVIDKKRMTVGTLNQRITMYCKFFKVNKPSPLDLKRIKEKNLNATAAEVLNLAYMLPFVLRKKNFLTRKMESTCDPQNVKCYILRLRILNLLMADKLTLDDVTRLRSMMFTHHTLSKELYNCEILKFHTELHFGLAILLYGPPRQQWCFRFEAKHAFFKRLCRICRAFVNLTYTLSFRHQMRQGGMMFLSLKGESGPFLGSSSGFGASYSIVVNTLKHSNLLFSAFPDLQAESTIMKYNVVKLHGVNIRRKGLIVVSVSDPLPEFGEIVAMYVNASSDLALVYKKLITTQYDKNCNAFSVKYGDSTGIILAVNIPYHHQLFYLKSVGANYVIMPCRLYV